MKTANEALISVIIPVFNQERYVGKCLSSILLQDYANLEVIVVNDGSTDESLSIVKAMADKDDRISIIDKANEGVSFARRDGMRISSGEYICFVDSDDYLTQHAIKTLHDIIVREDADIVAGQFIRQMGFIRRREKSLDKIAERKITRPELWEDLYISYYGVNILPVQMCGKLYKKCIIDKAMTEDSLFCEEIQFLGEDEYFNLMLHPHVSSMYITNEPVYVYRYGGGTTKYNPHLTELYDFSDLRIQLLDQYGYTQGYNTLFIEYKNYIFSDICQRLEYRRETKEQIFAFLNEELGKREVFKRMQVYYRGKIVGEEMTALLSQDFERIWALANKRYRQGYKRRALKKFINWFF